MRAATLTATLDPGKTTTSPENWTEGPAAAGLAAAGAFLAGFSALAGAASFLSAFAAGFLAPFAAGGLSRTPPASVKAVFDLRRTSTAAVISSLEALAALRDLTCREREKTTRGERRKKHGMNQGERERFDRGFRGGGRSSHLIGRGVDGRLEPIESATTPGRLGWGRCLGWGRGLLVLLSSLGLREVGVVSRELSLQFHHRAHRSSDLILAGLGAFQLPHLVSSGLDLRLELGRHFKSIPVHMKIIT